jgi:TRAP-type C4-dicarboxylate transport system substrate-binding protein
MEGDSTKKAIGIVLALMMVVGLAFIAAQPASAAALEIKFATQNPTAAWIHPHGYVAWAKKMEEATEGRVKVTIYPAQTLGKGTEFYDLVKNGVADLVFGIPTSTPGMFPLTEIFSLPLLGFQNAAQAGRIEWEIYKKFPAFQKEYAEVQMLGMAASGPFFLANINRPVKKIEDLKGLKVRVPGGRPADAFKAVGAIPAMIPMPEVFISLEKGIIDSATVPWEGPLGYLPLKSIKYWCMGWELYNVPFYVAMNKETWKKISEKDQKAIMGVWGEYGSEGFSKAVWDDSMPTAMKVIEENKIQVVQADPAEVAKWRAMAKSINQGFVDELKAKKLPAQEIYDMTLRMIQETTK